MKAIKYKINVTVYAARKVEIQEIAIPSSQDTLIFNSTKNVFTCDNEDAKIRQAMATGKQDIDIDAETVVQLTNLLEARQKLEDIKNKLFD